MKFITSSLKKLTVKSKSPLFIDFERENRIVNLSLVYSFSKRNINISETDSKIPTIRFYISKDTWVDWFYNNEDDRDFDYNKILNDFVWVYDNVSYPVWLSSENQFNYKAIYDLAIQTNGKNLPVMFKFGTVEEPVYYTFNTIEELNDFYLKSTKFIQQTLEDGWKEKDTFDFSPYMK